MRGPATTIMRRSGTRRFASGNDRHDAPQQVIAHARATDGDDADALVGPVAKLGADRLAVGEGGGIEAGDVAGEVVVALGPVADRRQIAAKRVGHDVVGIADEDGAVADAAVALDLLDHLGVVVGGQEGLALAAIRHRQVADEVGHPDVGGALLLWVLVQVVVQLPGLVADPEVVLLLGDDIVEEHVVGDQDLVHAAQRLEDVQVVLGGLALDVARLIRQQARWPGGCARRAPRGLW